jgi:hypothetical protein
VLPLDSLDCRSRPVTPLLIRLRCAWEDALSFRLNHPRLYLGRCIARFCSQSAIFVSTVIILEISFRYFAVRIPHGRGGILSLNAHCLSIQLSRRRIFEAVRRNRPLALFNWHS